MIQEKLKDRIFSFVSTSSRNSIGVFCGDEVVDGLKTVLAEFVDDVRLPIERRNDFLGY